MTTAVTNLAEFNAQVDEFAQKVVPDKLVALQTIIALEALKRIVQKTPVDKGRARGNWQITIGVAAVGAVDVTDKAGGDTIARGIEKLTGLGPYQVVYITNNLPYIEVLEDGGFDPRDPGPSKDPRKSRHGRVLVRGGFSVQSPRGMVKVTIEELQAMNYDV